MDKIEEINIALHESAKAVERVAYIIQDLSNQAEKRVENIYDLSRESHQINATTKMLDQINENIKRVDDQTSLLSINTAIQAAHLGENGKTFGVIAKEMKMLADKSRKDTADMTKFFKDIETKTENINKGIDQALENAQVNSIAMQEVAASIQQVTASIQEITTALEHLVSNQ